MKIVKKKYLKLLDSRLIIAYPDGNYSIINTSTGWRKVNLSTNELMGSKEMKKTDFYTEVNLLYRNVTVEWEFGGKRYKNLKPMRFQDKESIAGRKYFFPKKGSKIHGAGTMVFYQGKVSIMISGNKEYLICPYSGRFRQYVQFKNVCPIYCITTKSIV